MNGGMIREGWRWERSREALGSPSWTPTVSACLCLFYVLFRCTSRAAIPTSGHRNWTYTFVRTFIPSNPDVLIPLTFLVFCLCSRTRVAKMQVQWSLLQFSPCLPAFSHTVPLVLNTFFLTLSSKFCSRVISPNLSYSYSPSGCDKRSYVSLYYSIL